MIYPPKLGFLCILGVWGCSVLPATAGTHRVHHNLQVDKRFHPISPEVTPRMLGDLKCPPIPGGASIHRIPPTNHVYQRYQIASVVQKDREEIKPQPTL